MRLSSSLALLLLAACSSSSTPADAGVDALGPVDLGAPSCTADDIPPTCDPGASGETLLFVVSRLAFADSMVVGTTTVSDGFDLDGTAIQVCGAADFTQREFDIGFTQRAAAREAVEDATKFFRQIIEHRSANTFAPEGASRCRAVASGLFGPGGGVEFHVSIENARNLGLPHHQVKVRPI